MKFICTITINKPLNIVSQYFQSPEALKNSQKDFIRIEHLSGNKGEAGAKSRLVYKKFDLIETIVYNKLPNEFYAKYEHKNMNNSMLTKFVEINENETLMTAEIDYTKFKGFVVKLIAKLIPGLFKKQVDKWLVNFKKYVETY
ncbi:MAG: SRPBCC family protein [Flaviramulus sp.]|nr:hypothetical protein [Flaviramulus sp.]NNC49360.1 SRPBCC family protein [Flaviramulus sp.]